jgi:hypothetical protein
VALAEVYPLVTAGALARPFTYEVDESVSRGAVPRSQPRDVVGV